MKKLLYVLTLAVCSATVFAFNPPAGGQSLFNLSSPVLFSSANSSAGGAIFMPGPDSISVNPALPAMEMRSQLDAGFSALISTNEKDDAFHSAFQAGILIPTKAFVASGILNGVFLNTADMPLSDSINSRIGLSKEISERLSVGFNINGGILWGNGTDWALGADLGVLYRRESLRFFDDFRLGFSLMNLGKYYSADVPGIDISKETSQFPSCLTFRAGTAALFLNKDKIKGGFSFDFSAPTFQNFVLDLGLQFSIKEIVFINVAESIDILEASNGHENFMPALSLGFKFNFNAKNNEYLKKHSWDSSDMLLTCGWKNLYGSIQDVSCDMRVYLGQEDHTPPQIQLWDGQD